MCVAHCVEVESVILGTYWFRVGRSGRTILYALIVLKAFYILFQAEFVDFFKISLYDYSIDNLRLF